MPTTLTNGIQLPDKGSVDWYNSMQSNYNLIDTHLGNTDTHVTAEDRANWNSKQGSLSQAQLDAIAQVATNTSDIATLQSGKANVSHTHSSSDITDIGDYATKQYVDNSISGLVDSAPNALDTLNELAAALNDDANFASTVATALGTKANSADLATVATSGSYTDLDNKPSIPTKTSDLTNDSNFVDTSNSAVASGITSTKVTDYDTHIADTDIHVTTADKTKWNNGVSQSYVLRYSSSSVTDNSTIAYSTLDNTDNIKASDKVIDVDGKIFSIVSVDTANQTVTVGSALVDLALDANVVHLSGDETVGGTKTFTSLIRGYNSDSTQNTVSIDLRSSKVTRGNTQEGADTFGIGFRDKYNSALMSVSCIKRSTGTTTEYHTVNTLDNSDNVISVSYSFNLNKDGTSSLQSEEDNQTFFGSSSKRWKGIYATNYYYGNDNVEFSTKFVTTDTNQTVTGNKLFEGEINSASSIVVSPDSTYVTGIKDTKLIDKNLFNILNKRVTYNNSRNVRYTWTISNKDTNGNTISSGVQLALSPVGQAYFYPLYDNDIFFGASTEYIKGVYTKLINSLTPSSLSLPNFANRVDIAGYISNLSGSTNTYTPTVNGWLYVGSNDASYLALFDTGSGGCGIRFSDGVVGEKYACIPCQANRTLGVKITCTNLAHAYFVPCLGNI